MRRIPPNAGPQTTSPTASRTSWSRVAFASLLLTLPVGCGECEPVLGDLNPSMIVTPDSVDLSSVPVADDTEIVFEVDNPSNVRLFIDNIELKEGSDPAFVITGVPPQNAGNGGAGRSSVDRQATEEIRVSVRPRVVGEISAVLIVTGEPDTVIPGIEGPTVEIPITVNAQDLGLPDIEVVPEEVEFERIGQGDVVREQIQINNVGVRDLILDETSLIPAVAGDESIKLTLPIQAGWIVAPGESVTTEVIFAPQDTDDHNATLTILSNDPDESPLEIPIHGAGSACPVAIANLLDDPEDIEPLDTIRLDGRDSYPVTPDSVIETYEWVLEQRPVGSTAILSAPGGDRTELTCDIAGDYQVRLTVIDDTGVRSCGEDAVIRVTAKPSADLHIQLVWDHPSADFDLHVLREGGESFTPEGDLYFSNKMPQWFPDAPESNPTLDADDEGGYGPENANIIHPIPGSKWTVLVHYWNKQTDADPFAIATLRLYALGIQVLDLPQSFEDDELLWSAVEIEWAMDPEVPPSITQIGLIENFPRPF